MTELVCPECDRRHDAGLTGIDADGRPTCLDCHSVLERGDA